MPNLGQLVISWTWAVIIESIDKGKMVIGICIIGCKQANL